MNRFVGWQGLIAVALLLLVAHGAVAAERGTAPGSTSAMCQTVVDVAGSSTLVFSHVHPLDESLAASLRTGVRRSQTLAWLVEHLENLDGVVYLFPGAVRRLSQGVTLRGGMSHNVGTSASLRIIRISVETGRGDMTIATIGHELRHAIEVLEAPGAVDLRGVEKLYERIGFLVRPGIYETTAAHVTENHVYEDLKRCRL